MLARFFHAYFVYLNDKVDGHVPADLVQEWQVKESKSYIKHIFKQVKYEYRTPYCCPSWNQCHCTKLTIKQGLLLEPKT